MTTATEINLQRLDIPVLRSVYPEIGRAYLVRPYSIDLSPTLVKTGKNYYDSQDLLSKMIAGGELPEGTRFSTAAEELALQRSYELKGKDPREAEEFRDHMGKGRQGYVWGHTLTGLRVPKDIDPNKYETDGQGRKHWRRILLLADKEIGEVSVPEGSGRIIVEADDASGLAVETEAMDWPHTGYNVHWYFNPNPRLDGKSGRYDVAVIRRGYWHHDEGRCLSVIADYERWNAYSDDGFRPVRGSTPKIEMVSSNVDIEQIRREIEEKIRADVATELRPLTTLIEKYK